VGVIEGSFEIGAVFGAACAAASGEATSAGDRGATMETTRCVNLLINECRVHATHNMHFIITGTFPTETAQGGAR
jgi:hypothetical protein